MQPLILHLTRGVLAPTLDQARALHNAFTGDGTAARDRDRPCPRRSEPQRVHPLMASRMRRPPSRAR